MEKMGFKYTVDSELFDMFPDYRRGVVLAYDVQNGDSPQDLAQRLRRAEDEVRDRLSIDGLTQNAKIESWRNAYKAFGAKPSKFRPSMEAMIRRVLKDQQLPSINTVVDIGNVVSLRNITPIGGHAIDVIKGDIALRKAKGEEEFVPFGSDQLENPEPGEIILAEGNTVLTRRWTWRQANHTLMVPDTKALLVNVDALPPVGKSEVIEICHEIMELLGIYCQGSASFEILCKETPEIAI